MFLKISCMIILCLSMVMLLWGCGVKIEQESDEFEITNGDLAPYTSEPDLPKEELKYDIQHVPLYTDDGQGFGIFSTPVVQNKIIMGETVGHLSWYDLETGVIHDLDMPEGYSGILHYAYPDMVVFRDMYDNLYGFDYEMNLITEATCPPYTVPEEHQSSLGPDVRYGYNLELTEIYYCQSYYIEEDNRRVSSGLVKYDPKTGTEQLLRDGAYQSIYYMPEHNSLFLYYGEEDEELNYTLYSSILHLDDLHLELLENSPGDRHHINGGNCYYIRLGHGYYDKIAGEYHIRPDVIPENTSYGISRDGNLFYFFDRNKSLIAYEKSSDTSAEHILGWDFKENDVIGVADNGDVVVRCRGSETMQGGLYRIRF